VSGPLPDVGNETALIFLRRQVRGVDFFGGAHGGALFYRRARNFSVLSETPIHSRSSFIRDLDNSGARGRPTLSSPAGTVQRRVVAAFGERRNIAKAFRRRSRHEKGSRAAT
jgi:hypothetical protein